MLPLQKNHQLVVCVGLIECEGKCLITRRYDPNHPQWHHRWEFPGGKIQPLETPLEAIHREIYEETALKIHSSRLLGVYTQHWKMTEGTQQTFILFYHCLTDSREVYLCPEENDDFLWDNPESIVKRTDLLNGNSEMLQELYLDACSSKRL